VPDPGGLGFGSEGHRDRGVQLAREQPSLAAGIALVDLELPGAVQRDPGGTLQLGARMLGARDLRVAGERGIEVGGELLGAGEEGGERRGQVSGASGHGAAPQRGSALIGPLQSNASPHELQRENSGGSASHRPPRATLEPRTTRRWAITVSEPADSPPPSASAASSAAVISACRSGAIVVSAG